MRIMLGTTTHNDEVIIALYTRAVVMFYVDTWEVVCSVILPHNLLSVILTNEVSLDEDTYSTTDNSIRLYACLADDMFGIITMPFDQDPDAKYFINPYRYTNSSVLSSITSMRLSMSSQLKDAISTLPDIILQCYSAKFLSTSAEGQSCVGLLYHNRFYAAVVDKKFKVLTRSIESQFRLIYLRPTHESHVIISKEGMCIAVKNGYPITLNLNRLMFGENVLGCVVHSHIYGLDYLIVDSAGRCWRLITENTYTPILETTGLRLRDYENTDFSYCNED